MKNIIFAAGLALTLAMPIQAATGETTKVCVDVKDKAGNPVKGADGKVKQNCKEMKVHKKLEGTEVPTKK